MNHGLLYKNITFTSKIIVMAQVELIMPKMGESITEATVLSWLKKPGDKIELEESVLEVATDKVDTDIPSTHAGVLKEILVQQGEIVQVGKAIAILTVEKEESNDTTPESPTAASVNVGAAQSTSAKGAASHSNGKNHSVDFKSSTKFFSPLVKNIAKEENITVAELEAIEGTGVEGRITKKDILDYVENRKLGATLKPVQHAVNVNTATPKISVSLSAGDEIIEMDRMRKMIAERMVESKRIAPHVTSFVEADVTSIIYWRNKVKSEFQKRSGDPLTFTPFFIEAVVNALKDYPMVNIQVDGDRIIKKKEINIGMAVALPSGNLIVPVIKNADQYSLAGLAKVVNDLAKRARDNKLKPDELSGGTFTISNVGSFGNVMGTPIIVQPQVGIIALGTIQKKPAVMETPYGDVIAIRHKMFLSHSYDHRVVDGALGGSMVRRVADYLEKFDTSRSL
jgi:2-oxoglutarate dehydrogenase E2 component (dihydrolipoamide succinyltransferase)